MKFPSKVSELCGSALIALLMSFSLVCALLGALSASFSPPVVVLCCAAAIALCVFATFNKFTALAMGLCVVLGAGYFVVARINPLSGLSGTFSTIGIMISGGETSLGNQGMALMIVLSAFFGILSFLMARLSGGVFPAILVFAFVLLGCWFLSGGVAALYLVPGLIALAVLYARAFREGGSVLRAMPAALVAALIAVMLMPSTPITWAPLQECADKVREMFNDYFLFNDPRTVYSVGSDGFQPSGDVLGGPASPNEEEVMRVETDTSLLLRGAVSKTYTGYSWTDESVNSRYLFIDPTRLKKRDATFDVDLLRALNGCVRSVEASVTMLGAGTSTLFVPHRLEKLDMPLDMVTYYNETGEVFITRDVASGDQYGLTAWIVDTDLDTLAAAINAAGNANDSDFQAVSDDYMNLSASVEAELYWLVTDIIKDCETPFDKARAISEYMANGGFTYTLEADYLPRGRDFVSWFVLDYKKGYCTYYASAMTVMARLAGIPARYVEGYRVIDDGSGDVLVTGESAHAWAELYFNGVGWLAFDVTPGGTSQEEEEPDTSRDDLAGDTPESTPTPTPEPDLPDATPTPEPDQPDATPTPEPDVPSDATATPEPDDQSVPEPSVPPEDDHQKRDNPFLMILLGLLIFLLIVAVLAYLIWNRLRKTDPKYLASREKDAKVKVMIWYRAILQLVGRSGMAPLGGETPEVFAERLVKAECAPRELITLARMIAQMQYSRYAPDPDAARMGEMIYGGLLRKMDKRQRLRWNMERMLHGMGDYKQIP